MKREFTPDGVPKAVKKQEGAALKRLWDQRKPMTQSRFSTEVLHRSEGYLPQFFKGLRPLTLDVATHFATHLKCSIADFSERLAKLEAEERSKVVWPFSGINYADVAALEDWELADLEGKIRSFLLKRAAERRKSGRLAGRA